jgi:hypothetical protein
MQPTLWTALLGFLGSVIAALVAIVVAVLTYRAAKEREREAEWRKEKLGYYKTFTESLSGIIEGDATPDGHRAFAQATNNLLLLAPQSVVEAVTAFREEIRVANFRRSGEAHDRLLAAMFLAIRGDVGITPSDDPRTFRPKLWASGSPKQLAQSFLPSPPSPLTAVPSRAESGPTGAS